MGRVPVSGHATHVTVIVSLFGRGDLIVPNALAHSSIVQGAQLSGRPCNEPMRRSTKVSTCSRFFILPSRRRLHDYAFLFARRMNPSKLVTPSLCSRRSHGAPYEHELASGHCWPPGLVVRATGQMHSMAYMVGLAKWGNGGGDMGGRDRTAGWVYGADGSVSRQCWMIERGWEVSGGGFKR
jgi:hypothetical protein